MLAFKPQAKNSRGFETCFLLFELSDYRRLRSSINFQHSGFASCAGHQLGILSVGFQEREDELERRKN